MPIAGLGTTPRRVGPLTESVLARWRMARTRDRTGRAATVRRPRKPGLLFVPREGIRLAGISQRRVARRLMLETPYLATAPTARLDRNRYASFSRIVSMTN